MLFYNRSFIGTIKQLNIMHFSSFESAIMLIFIFSLLMVIFSFPNFVKLYTPNKTLHGEYAKLMLKNFKFDMYMLMLFLDRFLGLIYEISNYNQKLIPSITNLFLSAVYMLLFFILDFASLFISNLIYWILIGTDNKKEKLFEEKMTFVWLISAGILEFILRR